MKKGIIGKKIGMTQIFDENGKVIPVTVIEAGPCVVTQKKTVENDGYDAVQVGFGDVKVSKLNKPSRVTSQRTMLLPRKLLKSSALRIARHSMSAISLRLTHSLRAKS